MITLTVLGIGSGAVAESRGASLGVLEDSGVGVGSDRYRVRVAFEVLPGARWRALPSGVPLSFPDDFDEAAFHAAEAQLRSEMPTQQNWSVCFDGAKVGSIESVLPGSWSSYEARGTERLRSATAVPLIGRTSKEFAGWRDEPVHRPLVLSSAGLCRDPGGWKRTDDKMVPLANLLPMMKLAASNGSVLWKSDKVSLDESTRLTKSYRAVTGARVLRVNANDVEGATFYVDPSGEVTYLGNWMVLVDAGDYDGDGKSEVVFMFQREDHDGYVMFDELFRRYIAVNWIYH